MATERIQTTTEGESAAKPSPSHISIGTGRKPGAANRQGTPVPSVSLPKPKGQAATDAKVHGGNPATPSSPASDILRAFTEERIEFLGAWRELVLDEVMSATRMSLSETQGNMRRWTKEAAAKEAYPLVVETAVNAGAHVIVLHGYVIGEDGRSRLTLDGDDGVSRHAKSGAQDDFDTICDALRTALSEEDTADGDAVTSEASQEAATPSATVSSQPVAMTQPVSQSAYGQPVAGMAPYGAQVPGMPPQQGYPQPGYQPQGMPVPQQPYGMMAPQAVPQQAPQDATDEFGYGSKAGKQDDEQPGIAPGWAVQNVPNKCALYVTIACLELVALIAEAPYVTIYNIVIPMSRMVTLLFTAWPALPAIRLAILYRNAFQAGNARLALFQMRKARKWIIGCAIWLAVLMIMNLTMCA